MGELSPVHWLIILLLFAVLFGARRLPDAARGLGKSLRIFKSEMTAAAQDAAPTTPPPGPAPSDQAPSDQAPSDQDGPPATPAPASRAATATGEPQVAERRTEPA